ncbi:hypothetical protein TNCV_4469901 [Trichonephila clavipes]|nr:hypothetical protein TNCV_4469901 [Trichonephila clavipes]
MLFSQQASNLQITAMMNKLVEQRKAHIATNTSTIVRKRESNVDDPGLHFLNLISSGMPDGTGCKMNLFKPKYCTSIGCET